ncbi:type 1 periplasmic binding fold superfamily protein [Polaribacter sargassicola]|uniref:type 1 periplasmic binding fold superfamily protein n=1 Tax=Polaribacter sargassicola TaxID=2836891 RepID=UPI001F1DA3B3|nr:type 1 periplasmic binding fold superfamily protein [Polaribacter sp. DS7-9]MCG1036705.1 type 1 periplasmic binding fold superfamily protein [Polaribacter sp. DS7-9]
MKSIKHILILASIILATACSNDDDPEVVNEEELITTVTVTLTSQEDGTEIVLNSVDLDGDGPNEPVVTGGVLAANTIYTGSTKVLNETEDPAEDITEEVLEEGVDHQFFYSFANSLAIATYTDADENGDPIGITFTLSTSSAGSENLTVSLIHEPNKSGEGVIDGNITNADGETDAEVTFPLTIE